MTRINQPNGKGKKRVGRPPKVAEVDTEGTGIRLTKGEEQTLQEIVNDETTVMLALPMDKFFTLVYGLMFFEIAVPADEVLKAETQEIIGVITYVLQDNHPGAERIVNKIRGSFVRQKAAGEGK